MIRSEKIQSGVAIFIALLALATSFWQGCEQRRHNRYTIRPLLSIQFLGLDSTKTLRLVNNGFGPALIEEFIVKSGENKWTGEDGNPWAELAKEKGLEGRTTWMWYYSKGSTIDVDENAKLFAFIPDSIWNLDAELIIRYKSIYEEEFILEASF